MPRAASPPELVRALGRWTLTALVLNGIIGAGIFGLPSAVARLLGPAALWAYVGAAAAIGVIMAVFAEVSSQYRESGGQYLYARDALGRFAGIQIGWFALLVRLTSAAAVTNLFVVYLAEFWPRATEPACRAAIMLLLVGGFAALNYRGVRTGARVVNVFVVAKLASLALFIAGGLWLGVRHAPADLAATPGLGGWTDALIALVYAYGGFEAAGIPAGETTNPRRDAPFALLVSLAVVTVVFLLVHLVAMETVPALAQSERPLADAARAFAGPAGARAIALGALLSTLGWLSVAFVAVPRLTFALAEHGDFPRPFAAVHARFRTPHVSILTWAVLVFVLALGGNFIWNAILAAAARLVTYGSTCLALLVLRRRAPAADAWRAPAGRLLAVLGLAFCVALAFRLNASHLGIMGAVAVVAGVNWMSVRRH